MARVIDMDEPVNGDTYIVVGFNGVKLPLSRSRLLELLRNEQAWLGGEQHAMTSAPPPSVVAPPVKGSLLSPPRVTHASLSYRIKRLHQYTKKAKRLREAQLSMLRELFVLFDGVIPKHPNTQLDLQLLEMASWPHVTPKVRGELEAFVERYRAAREAAASNR